MDAAAFHTQYETLLTAFLQQLPDVGLRVALRQQADGYLRQCALGVWRADGGPVTPRHADWYNGIYLGRASGEALLYWALTDQVERAAALPTPPFFDRLCRYDRQTGHATARRFLDTLSAFLLLFARADGSISPQEAEAIQAYLDGLFAQWTAQALPGDKTPPSVRQFITPTSPPNRPSAPPPEAQVQPIPQPQEALPEEPQPTLEDLLSQLDELCGLETVKKEVRGLINLVKVRRLREEAGLPTPPLSLHMVFLGNPGLESRFNKYLTFDDYTAGQLLDIFHSMCKKNGYALSPAAETKAAETFQALYDHRDENFGNAREVRNTFEDAVARQANRVAGLAKPSKEDLMAILPEDLSD